ncbi:MAG TPA: carboxypeptidase M32 [Pseudomonadales bacterium]|nr:carboxypeptidase M32 [Pseudomonadales bacterium]
MTYAAAEARFRELGNLGDASSMLKWDEAVMMPAGGGEARARVMATLAGLHHDRLAAPEVADWLAAAEADADGLDAWQRANLREMRRSWRDAAALPGDLVRAHSLARSRCEHAWRTARGRNDWQGVLPLLEELMGLTRAQAQALAEPQNLPAYDALVARFQPGIAVATIDRLFGELRRVLPPLVDRVIGAQAAPTPVPGGFEIPVQKALAETLMRQLGFDFEHGRLDVSHHPFCGGVPDDVRMTTRYADDGILDAQMAVIHETGHALYNQALPAAWRTLPVGKAAGMAVHESQSLTMEMQVGRSRPFLAWAAPVIEAALTGRVGGDGAFSADNLWRLATHVERGLIRVDADELTYPLHVILRFEMEKRLIDGSLAVADLPEAWDASMREMLDLSTGDDHRDGVMQDVHWFAGLVGYFPSYTLGAVMAAQFFDATRAAVPDIEDAIGRGEIAPLREWLRTEIHGRGSLLEMTDLLVAVTGRGLDVAPYVAHLERRYVARAW